MAMIPNPRIEDQARHRDTDLQRARERAAVEALADRDPETGRRPSFLDSVRGWLNRLWRSK
jgi:hypothetical protein